MIAAAVAALAAGAAAVAAAATAAVAAAAVVTAAGEDCKQGKQEKIAITCYSILSQLRIFILTKKR